MRSMTSLTRRLVVVLMALGLVAAACGGDDTDSAAEDGTGDDAATATDTGDSDTGDSDTGDADDEGRPGDISREDATSAIMTGARAVGAEPDRVEWDGDTARVIYEEGSAEDLTATTLCSAVDIVIAGDESAVIVFPDGEVDCDDRP